MVNLVVGQKVHVKANRNKRSPKVVEATVKEIQSRFVICNYLGRDYKFYKYNGKQVISGSVADELIPDIMAYNKELEEEQLYKDAEKLLTDLVRVNRSLVLDKLKKLSSDEVKAFKYLLQKIY